MAKQSRTQKKKVGRVMHEFKHGELKSSTGGKVKNPKQAIAIALSEAGASRKQGPAQKKRAQRRTSEREAKGRTAQARREGRSSTRASASRSSKTARSSSTASRGGKTKGELYAEARRRDIPGRSRMSKAQLARAVGSR